MGQITGFATASPAEQRTQADASPLETGVKASTSGRLAFLVAGVLLLIVSGWALSQSMAMGRESIKDASMGLSNTAESEANSAAWYSWFSTTAAMAGVVSIGIGFLVYLLDGRLAPILSGLANRREK